MKPNAILWSVIVIAVGVVVFRPQQDASRTIEREPGYAQVTERTIAGSREWVTRSIPLPVDPKTPTQRLEWFATTYADTSKPAFVVSIKNVEAPRSALEGDTKKS